MARQKEPINPFYILLVALGVVFLITACAYGVMAYRAIAPARANVQPHPLTAFLDRAWSGGAGLGVGAAGSRHVCRHGARPLARRAATGWIAKRGEQ